MSERDRLAERIRAQLSERDVREQAMFGGITFMLAGNMLCCASRDGLMARVGKDKAALAIGQDGAAPCMGTGRPMPGFLMVEHANLSSDERLAFWIDLACEYVVSLPAK